MNVSESERQAIVSVVQAGKDYGFGNMIAHLQTAWAKTLMEKWNMPEEHARQASGGTGYPFLMHEDVMRSGEWDESGKRYRIGAHP